MFWVFRGYILETDRNTFGDTDRGVITGKAPGVHTGWWEVVGPEEQQASGGNAEWASEWIGGSKNVQDLSQWEKC